MRSRPKGPISRFRYAVCSSSAMRGLRFWSPGLRMVDRLAKYGTAIKVFGAVLFALCAAGLIWSLFRPAITHGPMPPEPAPMGAAKDAGSKG